MGGWTVDDARGFLGRLTTLSAAATVFAIVYFLALETETVQRELPALFPADSKSLKSIEGGLAYLRKLVVKVDPDLMMRSEGEWNAPDNPYLEDVRQAMA